MFKITPVMEGEGDKGSSRRASRVSFSPDVDDSYRMNVIDKIKGLMEEVDTIHRKEEKQLTKAQEADQWRFKQKQEKELQDFLKRQKQESFSFESFQVEEKHNLKERQTQETLRLFGTTSNWGAGASGGSWASSAGWNNQAAPSRTTVMNLWDTPQSNDNNINNSMKS